MNELETMVDAAQQNAHLVPLITRIQDFYTANAIPQNMPNIEQSAAAVFAEFQQLGRTHYVYAQFGTNPKDAVGTPLTYLDTLFNNGTICISPKVARDLTARAAVPMKELLANAKSSSLATTSQAYETLLEKAME